MGSQRVETTEWLNNNKTEHYSGPKSKTWKAQTFSKKYNLIPDKRYQYSQNNNNNKICSTQQSKIHNVWHQNKSHQMMKEAENNSQ